MLILPGRIRRKEVIAKLEKPQFLTCGPNFYGGSSGGPSSDPYFSNVVALLHFNGANDSTTITDSSSHAATVTNAGTQLIKTAQSKFGGSSILLTNGGASMSDAAYARPGTGALTVEFWAYWNSYGSNYVTVFHKGYGVAGGLLFQTGNNDGKINIYEYATSSPTLRCTESTAPGTGAWIFYRIKRTAIVSSSATWTIERNGTTTATYTGSCVDLNSTSYYGFGGGSSSGWNNYYCQCYADDFRYTVGVARTEAVPTAQFPDS